MEFSQNLSNAFQTLMPGAPQDEVYGKYAQIKNQFPDASEDEIADNVMAAAGVVGKTANLNPKQSQLANQYQAQDEQIKKLEGIGSSIDQQLSAVQQEREQDLSSNLPFQVSNPDELRALQEKINSSRSPMAEGIGGAIAALGGTGVAQNYQRQIAAKRADENAQLDQFSQRQKAESNALNFQKSKDEYLETRKVIKAQYAEAANRYDPKSQVSQLTQQLVGSFFAANPGLKKLEGIENMSAAQLEKVLPAFSKMADLAEKKVENERKARESDAKFAVVYAKIAADNRKAEAEGGITPSKATDVYGKSTKDIAEAQAELDNVKKGKTTIQSLRSNYAKIDKSGLGTGPVVGSDIGMTLRGLGSEEIQKIGNDEGNLTAQVAKTFGTNPSDNETRILQKLSRLSKMDTASRNATLDELEQALNDRERTSTDALASYKNLQSTAGSKLGYQPTGTSAPTKTVTRAQIEAKAKSAGASVDEVTQFYQDKGWSIQ